MNYVFVDFEMNPIERTYKNERKLYRQEIIEIGAVMLDENMNEISTFKRYVKPEYSSHIARKITELTGICDGTITYASHIASEFNDFASWCIEESGCDFTVYAWSENDLDQVMKEIELKNLVINDSLQMVIDSWKDLQVEYDEAVGATNRTGLTRALEALGIYFEGQMHDALDDSRNTATIFRELQNPEAMLASMAEIKSYYEEPKGQVVTLGDLFDFSVFGFSA